jgi:hypothetical protein
MGATTSYGTWVNHAKALSVETTVADYINGGGAEWVARVHATGAFDRMVADYRAAVNANLPEGITLHGDEFYGPYYTQDGPVAAGVNAGITTVQMIVSAVEDVDIDEIVRSRDPDAFPTLNPHRDGQTLSPAHPDYPTR